MKPKYNPAQMELFQTLWSKPGAREIAFSKPQVKAKPDHIVNLPYENIVVAGIAMLFLIILSFCLGVKRGEAIFKARFVPETKKQKVESIENLPDGLLSNLQPSLGQVKEVAVTEQNKTALAQVKAEDNQMNSMAPPISSSEKKYTIQLITYSRQSQAQQEVTRLKMAGADAFFLIDGRFYKVCSGAYANVDEAKADLVKFRKNRWYRDCFVRNIQGKNKCFSEVRKE